MIEQLHIENNFGFILQNHGIKESNSYCEYVPFYILKQNTDSLIKLEQENRQGIEEIYNNLYHEFQLCQDQTFSQYYTIAELPALFQENDIISHRFRLRNYEEGIYSPFNLEIEENIIRQYEDTKKFISLFSLVIPIKYVPYVQICLMLEEPIDLRVYEFWIKEDFDIKDSIYTNYRKLYRKYLLPDLKENNVPIVVKKDIDKELYFFPEMPKFKRTSDYDKYVEELVKDSIIKLRIDNGIQGINNDFRVTFESNDYILEEGTLNVNGTTWRTFNNSGDNLVSQIMSTDTYQPLTAARLDSFISNLTFNSNSSLGSNMPPEENLNHINNELYQEALRSMETSE